MRTVIVKIPAPPANDWLFKQGKGFCPKTQAYRDFIAQIVESFKDKRGILDEAPYYSLSLTIFQSFRRRRSLTSVCKSLIFALIQAGFLQDEAQIAEIKAVYGRPSKNAFAIMEIEVFDLARLDSFQFNPESYGEQQRRYTWYQRPKLIHLPRRQDSEDSKE